MSSPSSSVKKKRRPGYVEALKEIGKSLKKPARRRIPKMVRDLPTKADFVSAFAQFAHETTTAQRQEIVEGLAPEVLDDLRVMFRGTVSDVDPATWPDARLELAMQLLQAAAVLAICNMPTDTVLRFVNEANVVRGLGRQAASDAFFVARWAHSEHVIGSGLLARADVLLPDNRGRD